MGNVKGVSGPVLLPAKDYDWELGGRHEIEVPLRGKISELPGAPTSEVPGPDEFSIYEDNVFLMYELNRVLFATSQYPSLKDDECFSIAGLEHNDDKVIVHGEIIKSAGE